MSVAADADVMMSVAADDDVMSLTHQAIGRCALADVATCCTLPPGVWRELPIASALCSLGGRTQLSACCIRRLASVQCRRLGIGTPFRPAATTTHTATLHPPPLT